jgi:transcriptional regulator with XRE-family HTH domain
MSISHDSDKRLSFDKADRMRRALRVSGIAVGDMAEYLQVSRNTVTAWINGRNEPRRRDLAAFAMRTGFPVKWLETGEEPDDGGTPGGIQAVTDRYHRLPRRAQSGPRLLAAA